LRLTGIISCAGCPTKAYPEKILRRVDSLAAFGVKYIHFANCLLAFCPFVNLYAETIKKKYSEIELIKGTHESHISDEDFRDKMVCAFETKRNMPDIILGRI